MPIPNRADNKMKGICIALVLATATGFVTPPAAKSMQTVRQGTLDGMVGAGEETGGVPWDPMGFSKISEMTKSSEHDGNFPHPKFLREAELKRKLFSLRASAAPSYAFFTQNWRDKEGRIQGRPLYVRTAPCCGRNRRHAPRLSTHAAEQDERRTGARAARRVESDSRFGRFRRPKRAPPF